MFDKLAERIKGKHKPSAEEEEIEFKNLEEATEATFERPEPKFEPKEESKPSAIEGSNIELKVVRPESFDEVSTIADYLLEGCTVILNLELFDAPTTLRMLDFLNGVTYSTGGDIKQVAAGTYIITPHNVDVTGDDLL